MAKIKTELGRFEETVRNALEHHYVSDYEEDPKLGTINVSLDSNDIEFDLLNKLSTVLNTKLIDIGSSSREEGYCETCAYTQEITTLFIRGVKFD